MAGERTVRPRVKREPICPWCRQRHPYGQAVAYHDSKWDLYRCGRCDAPLDPDGECATEKCCGWSAERLIPRRRETRMTSTANTRYSLTLVGGMRLNVLPASEIKDMAHA